MAYSVVPTKVDGDLPYSAYFLNTYVRDNFAAGVPDIFTTKGDLAVATAADTATRLAVGTNDQILFAESGQATGVKWSKIPGMRAHGSGTSETTESATFGQVENVSAEDWDTTASYSSPAFTCPVAGYYLVIARMYVEPDIGVDSATYYEIGILKNDSLYSAIGSIHWETTAFIALSVIGADIVACAAGDVLKLAKRMENTSGTMASYGDVYNSILDITLIPV